MSELGQSRRSGRALITSALPDQQTIQSRPAFRKSQQATYRQEKVSADVNQFTDGNAATAVSLDPISGQFRKRLNTARCALNWVVREFRLP